MKSKKTLAAIISAVLLLSSSSNVFCACNNYQESCCQSTKNEQLLSLLNLILEKGIGNKSFALPDILESLPIQKTVTPVPEEVPNENISSPKPATNTTISASEYEQEVVRLVNDIRLENNLSALTINEQLCNIARMKSQDMKNNHYFDHTSPTYGSPFDMMHSFGITYRAAAENIAKGQSTPAEVVNAWMNSAGHRKNILGSSYTQIGVGYVASGNYWTQMFIG